MTSIQNQHPDLLRPIQLSSRHTSVRSDFTPLASPPLDATGPRSESAVYLGEQLCSDVRPKRVAIVGGASSRTQAPYDDPTWDIWAFSSLRLETPRFTRWFEMHALEDLHTQLIKTTKRKWSYRTYLRFLQHLECPVFMQRTHDIIPMSVAYPLDDALAAFGRCFTSTASYLLALAILEGYDTIGVWGIHLTERTVYARQRPGVEYLLGVAKQKGIHIHLPANSPLHIPAQPVLTPTEILYGYDWQSPKAWWRRKPRARVRRS